ncbi:hypothetical protein BE08_33015 [Sorangium cellulosum]|uniref:DEAD/DEAH box helicase n=1 Tax=Sorangium cellulosum TaxID=56 RepID=A0A150P294_SORCE|nr:hypothetical protein BE08_33015 [Sorangium cellulosum]
MDVFELSKQVVSDYGSYISSFLTIRDDRIRAYVDHQLADGFLWPQPLIQLNPAFEPGEPLRKLVEGGVLHPECLKIFAAKDGSGRGGTSIRLHRHQVEGIHAARAGESYVLTTGTGSGKSLSYIVPIVDHVLRRGSGKGIQALVVYPMNALANSQQGELEKFLCRGYADGRPPVTFRRYTGQESDEERREILANPPDILLTNYVMLELLLTRPDEGKLVRAAKGLRFLVLDELHTYRGRQGADVALLVRRVREACEADRLIHVGTSATLSSEGSWLEQQEEVARVASQLFGVEVLPSRIIGESLRRVTPPPPADEQAFHGAIRACIEAGDDPPAGDVERFINHPLASWIESTLGLRVEPQSGRLVRCTPLPLSGAGSVTERLACDTGLAPDVCGQGIRRILLAGHRCTDEHARPVFAFRLHQFVSKGESVYAGLDTEEARYISLHAQQFVPNTDRSRVLLPLAFCRECGQEYYVVRRIMNDSGGFRYVKRELSDRTDDGGTAGYLYVNTHDPWPSPTDQAALVKRLPDSWLEITTDGRQVVRKSQQQRLPREVFLSPLAVEGAGPLRAHFIDAPFLFCLRCSVAYDAHQSSDFGKLATLGSEGRSTATTVLSLSTVRRLRRDAALDREAQKLLSFTDNRQDASLQAGHFNDFVEVGLLRSALYRAARAAGGEGIHHEELMKRVFDALALPIELYAINPAVEYVQRDNTDRALRQAIGYYLYRDLRRGWRVTSPNLEQCGLLDIDYLSLDRFACDEARWRSFHPALATAAPEERERVCRVLLDFMRRELAIRVEFLDPVDQEGLRQLSGQYLVAPWSLDQQERLERSRIVFPRSRGSDRPAAPHFVYLSPLGGFGLFLKRASTFERHANRLKTEDVQQIIEQLLEALTIPGLVHMAMEKRADDDVPGYQLNASALIWRAGKGEQAFHDPVRVPNVPEAGLRTNPFFTSFYRQDTTDLKRLEAREHTAQVPSEKREEREAAFREGRLPILYCSPTMELGVDIRQLNVVNLRNVPPTPANYAQRSGRAGRSGQPAFVFTYCSSGSPHDQYFFRRPERMVAGAVSAPRLDLTNEDLLRAHVHAVWLGVARLNLGQSLADVLDVGGDEPSLGLLPKVQRTLDDQDARERARVLAKAALGEVISTLIGDEEGGVDAWIERVLRELPHSFERACERWKGLYRAALSQQKRQTKVIRDASRDRRDRDAATRLRNEAESQLRLLVERSSSSQSDFYSYRYFASEGFLPGYNFPRLPLSAYLEGRRRQKGVDEFLTRPRFLAISEFGPRSIIYHEGSRYVVNKVILPVDGEDSALKRRAALCEGCGYLHPIEDRVGVDLCERCGQKLQLAHENLFRMQNVATRRRDRINSDEEERVRVGYEIKTGVRFARRGGTISAQQATLQGEGGVPLATLVYGHAATLWRMNLGWRRRRKDGELGYLLDVERGIWARNESQGADEDPDDAMSPRVERVIPYVEDHRNCLLVEPASTIGDAVMASLMSALKAAIEVHFQLEDRELAAEPLPSNDDRRVILLYEASEGGAGVLRRLVEERYTLGKVAKIALELCHFDPVTREDRQRAPRAREDCEAACYDCLLSYFNQRDHRLLDRKLLPDILARWMNGDVATSPAPRPRGEQVDRLMRLTDSELERRWLRMVEQMGLKLPSEAQPLIESCHARPDFLYRDEGVAVFIDGPPHDDADQRRKDREQQDALEEHGVTVIRFHHADDWEAIFARYPSIFGRPTARSDVPPPPPPRRLDAPAPARRYDTEDFDARWHPLLDALSGVDGLTVAPGEEVMRGGRVIDLDVGTISRGGRAVHLVDAAAKTASDVAAALEARGARVLRVREGEADLVERVLAALEG